MEFKVAGVSFEGRQEICKQTHLKFLADGNIKVKLVPEPTNKYDKNAIKVIVLLDTWKQIGYVPKTIASQIVNNLEGHWARISYIGSAEEEGANTGVKIKVWFSQPTKENEEPKALTEYPIEDKPKGRVLDLT